MEIHDKRSVTQKQTLDSLSPEERIELITIMRNLRLIRVCSKCSVYYSLEKTIGRRGCAGGNDHCDWRSDDLQPMVFKATHWNVMISEMELEDIEPEYRGEEVIVCRSST